MRRGRRGVAGAVLAGALLAGSLAACVPADPDGPGQGGPPPGTAAPLTPPGQVSTAEYRPGVRATLHLPAATARAPLVVMVPGGSWRSADPSGLSGLATHLASAGVAALPVEIRAADDGVLYPAPVQDILCAAAHGAARSREAGTEADPVVVLGHSSGAHLGALAVLDAATHSGSCTDPAVVPDAFVGLAGPYDIRQVPELAQALFGATADEQPGLWREANPQLLAASRPGVPVLLLQGDADDLVPVSFAEDFGAALRAAGHPTVVELVRGADHHSIYAAEVAGDVVARWVLGLRTG